MYFLRAEIALRFVIHPGYIGYKMMIFLYIEPGNRRSPGSESLMDRSPLLIEISFTRPK